jgi:hypothetical protein
MSCIRFGSIVAIINLKIAATALTSISALHRRPDITEGLGCQDSAYLEMLTSATAARKPLGMDKRGD